MWATPDPEFEDNWTLSTAEYRADLARLLALVETMKLFSFERMVVRDRDDEATYGALYNEMDDAADRLRVATFEGTPVWDRTPEERVALRSTEALRTTIEMLRSEWERRDAAERPTMREAAYRVLLLSAAERLFLGGLGTSASIQSIPSLASAMMDFVGHRRPITPALMNLIVHWHDEPAIDIFNHCAAVLTSNSLPTEDDDEWQAFGSLFSEGGITLITTTTDFSKVEEFCEQIAMHHHLVPQAIQICETPDPYQWNLKMVEGYEPPDLSGDDSLNDIDLLPEGVAEQIRQTYGGGDEVEVTVPPEAMAFYRAQEEQRSHNLFVLLRQCTYELMKGPEHVGCVARIMDPWDGLDWDDFRFEGIDIDSLSSDDKVMRALYQMHRLAEVPTSEELVASLVDIALDVIASVNLERIRLC